MDVVEPSTGTRMCLNIGELLLMKYRANLLGTTAHSLQQ
jgi:hypothetical protein